MIDLLMVDIPTLLAQGSLPDSHESLAITVDRGEAGLSAFGLSLSIIGFIFLGVGVLAVAILVFPRILSLLLSFVRRLFEFVFLGVGDTVVVLFSVICLALAPIFAVFFMVLGRWGQANRKARWFGDNVARIVRCLGQTLLVRPLRLVFLDSTAAGVQAALPGHMPDGSQLLVTRKAALASGESPSDEDDRSPKTMPAPPSERSRMVDGEIVFPEFEVIGQLKAGGSGAKLYVANTSVERRMRTRGLPEQVVIKSFGIEHGSTLPSIVRESRALEAARSMGLVFEHHLEEDRFWYVMPYHAGPPLGTVVKKLHGANSTPELRGEPLREATGYVRDLVATLVKFHDSGLWHKDVKPDNLIVHDGRAHIVDLGLVTSLHSPLTLTTHGTEYFRDPELVRMALRGVKVNDVDGSKFDVYGAGAVLYFALENDFPAHGGLSDFSNEVPDALRWIVRRAMADYVKRYRSSAMLLADLDTVLAAEDMWAVRPADLPSMSTSEEELPAPPPPPFVHTQARPAAPPWSAPFASKVSRTPVRRPRVKRNKRPARVDNRAPVPADRPSAMLILLGVIAIVAIAFAVVSVSLMTLLPVQPASMNTTFSDEMSPNVSDWPPADLWPTEVTDATIPSIQLGRDTTTWTLTSPEDSSRLLLVLDEDDHQQSPQLREALGQLKQWSTEHYSVDQTPDLKGLGMLVVGALPAELGTGEAWRTGSVLSNIGYDGVARLVRDSNGNGHAELRIHGRDNAIRVIEITPDMDGAEPWTMGNGEDATVPDQGMAELHGEHWHAGRDVVDASALSCIWSHVKEPSGWTQKKNNK